MKLDAKIPAGPLAQKWKNHIAQGKLVAPNNRRKYTVIVVGAGLAGSSAAASLAELGYNVQCFVYHDSPRRAHSIAAQGGINAAKNIPERRRQHLPPLHRHPQGRRLPRP
jgi:succinate dehydrogenase / fumarate reductase flavoprotein subunit